MTTTLDFKQIGHLDAALLDPAARALNADKLTGRWLNTNPETKGIREILIVQENHGFTISATGAGEGGSIPWPATRADALANLEEEAGQRAVAFAVTFEFDFMRAECYLRVNKGVLVNVLFVTFTDDSGRSAYVNREFFYRP